MMPDEFHDQLIAEGAAERTAREYAKWLRRLLHWCLDQGHYPRDATPAQLRAWADTLPHGRASRKQAHAAAARYYRMIGRTDEPHHAIRVPRKPRPRYRGLPAPDALRLRDAALLAGGRPGRAVLIGLYTAARASEIAAMRWDGIDGDTARWWRSKTEEWHEVPLHPVLGEALRPRGEGFVFVGNNGRAHVSAATVWSWVRHVGELAGVMVTPHQLRVTAGNLVLEATGDLDAAAALLGHRDINVTRTHYTRTSERRLRAAVDALDYGKETA